MLPLSFASVKMWWIHFIALPHIFEGGPPDAVDRLKTTNLCLSAVLPLFWYFLWNLPVASCSNFYLYFPIGFL